MSISLEENQVTTEDAVLRKNIVNGRILVIIVTSQCTTRPTYHVLYEGVHSIICGNRT